MSAVRLRCRTPAAGASGRRSAKTGVTLPAGTHVLKLVVDANGSGGTVADVNWLQVTSAAAPPAPASTPYLGTPVALPNLIEAENYDRGGEGLAYHDTTTGNSSGAYRTRRRGHPRDLGFERPLQRQGCPRR